MLLYDERMIYLIYTESLHGECIGWNDSGYISIDMMKDQEI